jgi:hypothetical protein
VVPLLVVVFRKTVWKAKVEISNMNMCDNQVKTNSRKLKMYFERLGIVGIKASKLLVGYRLVAGSYKSSDHDRQFRSTVQ